AYWAALFGGVRRDEREEGGGVLGFLAMIIVAPIAASLIQLAISRAREYEADASGARILHRPEELASALEKIATVSGRIPLPAGPRRRRARGSRRSPSRSTSRPSCSASARRRCSISARSRTR